MYLLECAPISRNMRKEKLSYYVKDKIELGSIITIPIRSKNVPALVIKSTPLSDEKMAIKQAGFQLKKISQKKPINLFLEETVSAAGLVSEYFLTNTGSVLETFTPSCVLEARPPIIRKRHASDRFHLYSLQGGIEDRILEYKSMIRESFAQKKSVLLLAPTGEEVNFFGRELSRGIEKYAFIIASTKTPKEIKKLWTEALSGTHPVLIITTPFALTIPRFDIGTIIIERENSRGYLSIKYPYIDARYFAEKLAECLKCRCVIADTTLRIDTIWREEKDEIVRMPTSKQRVQTSSHSHIVDMKIDSKGEKLKFALLSSEALTTIAESIEENERVVVYATRRGSSPLTLCGDCESVVICDECGAPVVLHERGDDPYFLCHRCGERRSAKEVCKICGSWNLKALGIGIDRVHELLENTFPNAKIFVVSKDHSSNSTTTKKRIDEFYKTPRGILLGTEMILPYLERQFEHCIITSLDSLFGIPDYKMHEKIFHLVVTLRHLSSKTFLLQSRNANNFVLQSAGRGDVQNFYRQEIENRRMFQFPPFCKLIKCTIVGKKDYVADAMQKLSASLANLDTFIFPAFVPKGTGKTALSMLIRITEDKPLDSASRELLSQLPHNYYIEINPDSVV